MILTDKHISELVTEFYHQIAISPSDFELGLNVARDIYENQKCKNCGYKLKNGLCGPLRKIMDDDFGCKRWKPRQDAEK
jgi:hypothetical protein